ncbi:MAG: hypothetical protein GX678_01585 [Actinomycetales bacterium]|nr:hypothetical protein [Actinomycetales bacterium]
MDEAVWPTEVLALWVRSGNTGGVIELTEPQVWTLIGVFSTVLFAVFATTSGYFVRTMKAGFDRVDAQFDRVDAQFDRVDAQIDGLRGEMNAKFELVEKRLDYLDRDVQALSKRVLPDV